MNESKCFTDGATALQAKKDAEQLKQLVTQQGIKLPYSEALAQAVAERCASEPWNKVARTLPAGQSTAPAARLSPNPSFVFPAEPYNGSGLPLPAENVGSASLRMLGSDDLEPPPIDDDGDDEPEEECIVCQTKELFRRLIPVGETKDVIHINCMGDDYGFCKYCTWSHKEIAWFVDELNDAGECPIHAGESAMSPEEEEDMDSLIEYWQKNG